MSQSLGDESARSAASAAPTQRFRTDIEGLRAVAVLLVLLFHAGVPFIPGGFVGVDVFFVISGFLITGILIRETAKTGRLSLAGFYTRRIRRILPMSSVVLIAILIGSVFFLPASQNSTVVGSVTAAALFVANWAFAAQSVDYFAPDVATNPVLHFWSLSVEEQFYFIWPLLIVGIMMYVRRNKRHEANRVKILAGGLLFITAVSFIISVPTSHSAGDYAYFGLQTRLWELGIGGLVAIWLPQIRLLTRPVAWFIGWVGLAMILWSGLFLTREVVFPGWIAAIPVLGSAFVIIAGVRSDSWRFSAGDLLSVKPMQYVGERSYNLYLWHWPILVFAGAIATSQTLDEAEEWGVAPPGAAVIAVIITAILTVVTFKYIEQPLRHASFMKTPKSALPIGLAMITGVVLLAQFVTPAASVAVYQAKGGNPAVLQEVERLKESAETSNEVEQRRRECRSGQGISAQQAIEDWNKANCVFGDPNGSQSIALIGDSHSDMWLWGLDAAGKANGWKIIYAGRTNCPYMAVGTQTSSGTDLEEECVQWANLAFEEIFKKQGQFDLALMGRTSRMFNVYVDNNDGPNSQQSQIANLKDSIERTFEKFGTISNEIAVMTDPPRAEFDIPACIERNNGQSDECKIERESGLEDERKLVRVEKAAASEADTNSKIVILPFGDIFCSTEQDFCEVVSESGTILYRDSNHIANEATLENAEQLARVLIDNSGLNQN